MVIFSAQGHPSSNAGIKILHCQPMKNPRVGVGGGVRGVSWDRRISMPAAGFTLPPIRWSERIILPPCVGQLALASPCLTGTCCYYTEKGGVWWGGDGCWCTEGWGWGLVYWGVGWGLVYWGVEGWCTKGWRADVLRGGGWCTEGWGLVLLRGGVGAGVLRGGGLMY